MLWTGNDNASSPNAILKFYKKFIDPLFQKINKNGVLIRSTACLDYDGHVMNYNFGFCLDYAKTHSHTYAQGHCHFVLGQYEQALVYYMKYFKDALSQDTPTDVSSAQAEDKEKLKDDIKIVNMEPYVLSNVCICLILTRQTQPAEDLFLRVNDIMHNFGHINPHISKPHFLIMSLVIGTYYCTEGNFEKGIPIINGTYLNRKSIKYSRDCQADPFDATSWSYVRPCYLKFLECFSRKTSLFEDSFIMECVNFLDLVKAQASYNLVLLDRENQVWQHGNHLNWAKGAASMENLNTVFREISLFKEFLLESSNFL